MKLKIFLATLFFNYANANVLLQSPEKIDINQLEKQANEQPICFHWKNKSFKTSNKPDLEITYSKGQSGFKIKINNDTYSRLNTERQKLFDKIDEDIFEYQDNFDISPENKLSTSGQKDSYYIADPIELKDTPKAISFEELLEFIKTKKIIFYTGAGISAGKVPVMDKLENSLTLKDPNFVINCIESPEKIKKTFCDFCFQMLNNSPSQAHYALKDIALFKQCQIITENVDILHHKTGYAAINNPVPFLREHVKKEDIQEIDAIICLGLSHDDRGILSWYKNNNPNGIIISVNLDKSNFLSINDYLYIGDLQDVLPKLYKEIYEIKIRNGACE